MYRARGRAYDNGNTLATGGARINGGRKPKQFKEVLNTLLYQILDTPDKKTNAVTKAWDTICAAMEGREKGNVTIAAVRAAELVLAYGFGRPKEKVEHTGDVHLKVIVRPPKLIAQDIDAPALPPGPSEPPGHDAAGAGIADR